MISPKSSSAHYCSRRIREEGEEEGEEKKKGPSSYLIRRWEEEGEGGKEIGSLPLLSSPSGFPPRRRESRALAQRRPPLLLFFPLLRLFRPPSILLPFPAAERGRGDTTSCTFLGGCADAASSLPLYTYGAGCAFSMMALGGREDDGHGGLVSVGRFPRSVVVLLRAAAPPMGGGHILEKGRYRKRGRTDRIVRLLAPVSRI